MNVKKEQVKISIIVPVYNTEKYLNKCIDSLINQTMNEIEIIIINDGSKDNSEQIIKEYKDKRIKYFKNNNQGIGKTRNFGIKKTTGEFLMFIDSDDYIRKDCCEKLYKNAKENKSSIVVSDFYKDYNGKIEEIKISNFKTSSLKDNKDLLLIINTGPCNKIFKRELIVNNNIIFDEDHKYEDSPFVIDSIIYADKISKCNSALSYYCIHKNSETTTRDERVFDILYIVDILREKLKKYDYLEENMNIFTVNLLLNYTIQQRNQKSRKTANKFIDKVFEYLKKEIPDYKNKKYFKDKGFIRRVIEKNKIITKIYCDVARNKYGRR